FRERTPRGRAVARGLGTTHHTRTSFVFEPASVWPGYWQFYWTYDELPGDWRVASFCCTETEAVLDNILKFLDEVDNPIPRNGDVSIEALRCPDLPTFRRRACNDRFFQNARCWYGPIVRFRRG